MDEITGKLQEVFRNVFDDEDIVLRREMTAGDIEDWDSLTHIQLIIATEKAFKIKFSTAEVQRLKNVGEFIDLISRRLS